MAVDPARLLADRADEHIVELELKAQVYLNRQLCMRLLHPVSLFEQLHCLRELGQSVDACLGRKEESAFLAEVHMLRVDTVELLFQGCPFLVLLLQWL